ncbi:MAG: Gfo/Idh/MocA family oxidoreductase [Ilumatobacteraceae bacterium]|jgi:predicted dehydrogenase|nr:Gfo/Idh/MocA family oxidoreductase [Ilumatobacteraceae bacterium]
MELITGRIPSERVPELERAVAAGARVLVVPEPGDECAARLLGVRVVDELPRAEWFVTLVEGPHTARLDLEVPIVTALRTLRPVDSGVDVVATTSVRFEHRPTIVRRRIGAGAVIAVGIVDVDGLQAHATLCRVIDRLGRPDVTAPSRPLGLGVVGYGPFGGMGYLHGLAADETLGLRFVAAADPVTERLEAAGADFPGLHAHADAASLAADPDVDVAVVATPPVHHAEVARTLLLAGKHVVIEKPMCLRRDDADALVRLAADTGRVLTVHQSRRWDTDWLALRRVVESGEIGDVFNVETFVGGFEHPCRAWHSEESVSGGAIYDWGSHHVDWILQLYGVPPTRLLCTAHTRVWHDTTNADQVGLWMQWADGREATFRQSDVAAIRRPKFYVQGTAGTLAGDYRPVRSETIEPGRGHRVTVSHHAEAPVDLRVVRYDGVGNQVEMLVAPVPHPGWAFHRNLADHLLLGEPLAVRPEESRDVVAVLEAAHRSAAAGGELVELP